MMAGFALPVRTVVNSVWRWPTAWSIFSSPSRRVSSITGASSSVDQGPHRLPPHRARDVARNGYVEDPDGQVVLEAHRNGGGVHHPEISLQHFAVAQFDEEAGGRIPHRVGVVH